MYFIVIFNTFSIFVQMFFEYRALEEEVAKLRDQNKEMMETKAY